MEVPRLKKLGPAPLPSPKPQPADAEGSGQILITLGKKRYVMNINVSAAEVPAEPGVVIEMPKKSA